MSQQDGTPEEDGPEVASPQDDTIQLIDLLVKLARGRNLLLATVAVFVVLGLLYGLLATPTYMSSARVVPEAQSEAPQGLGGLGGGLSALQGLGINLGGLSSQGLSTNSYPEIVESREVRLAVVRDTFSIPESDTTGTLVQYLTGEIGLFARLKQSVRTAVTGTDTLMASGRQQTQYPTLEEELAMLAIQDRVTAYQNPDTGLMTISVTMDDPRLSATVVESFIDHLSEHVRTLRTEKARQNLEFIRERFEQAEEELNVAEDRLSNFLDRNQSINTAELRTRRQRLERQVQFKTDLYSELQAQLTQAQIDLQRSEPVITMVEKPVPPLDATSPQRLVILVLCILGGGIAGICLVLVRAYFREDDKSQARQAKIEEIREAFFPTALVEGAKERVQSWRTKSEPDG